jgi:hypothetical protein
MNNPKYYCFFALDLVDLINYIHDLEDVMLCSKVFNKSFLQCSVHKEGALNSRIKVSWMDYLLKYCNEERLC